MGECWQTPQLAGKEAVSPDTTQGPESENNEYEAEATPSKRFCMGQSRPESISLALQGA